VREIVAAARRLSRAKGSSFTVQELAQEAGIALQTFYRYFTDKDQLLLAVLEEEIMAEAARTDAAARRLPDPVARLRFFITSTLESLRPPDGGASHDRPGDIGPRFITAEHWRLHQLFPDEMARINQPFADMIERELREAAALGLLRPTDPAAGSWFTMKLVMSVYHRYAFATTRESLEDTTERLWAFCLAAFNGAPDAPSPAAGEARPERN
jgi:AcrR family transcriptional regulator